MTDRIPLDHLTSDQLDALYERLEDAERLKIAHRALSTATVEAVERAEQAEAQLRLVDAMRQQNLDAAAAAIQRAEQAEAKVTDYENRITWHTTCAACARTLDSSIRETTRAEHAEDFARRALAQRQEMAAERHAWQERGDRAEAERDGAYRERAHLLAWLATLHQEHAVIAPSIDVDEAGWQLLFLTVAGRQLSWHIAPDDADLFKHVEHVEWSDPRAAWDGHTTDEKYQRIRTLPFGEMRAAIRTPGPAEAALDRVRAAARLHRQDLINTAELHAAIGPALNEPKP